MPETIKIDHESQVPVYKQIVGQVEALAVSYTHLTLPTT